MANRLKLMTGVVAGLLAASVSGMAQDWAVSYNLGGLADSGLLNASASMTMSRHWSMSAGLKKQRMLTLGARYWPGRVYSGWWMSGAAQYQEYNNLNKGNNDTSEGDRIGASFSAGYSYMLTPWLNVEFGLGFWGGYDKFKVYDCSTCGVIVDRGWRAFLSPEDVIIALSIIF